MSQTPEFVHSVHLANRTDTGLRLILEPDLEEFKIPPGEAFMIIGRSSQDGAIDIEIFKSYVTAWPWRQASITILHNDAELYHRGPAFK
jgi:hypothetical protein